MAGARRGDRERRGGVLPRGRAVLERESVRRAHATRAPRFASRKPSTSSASDSPKRASPTTCTRASAISPSTSASRSASLRTVVERIEDGSTQTRDATFVSSVHLHLTLDAHDKASGTVAFLGDRFGEDATAVRERYAFVGDSSNDAPCFFAFDRPSASPMSRRSLPSFSVPPRFVASRPRGKGFAEIADRILELRPEVGQGPAGARWLPPLRLKRADNVLDRGPWHNTDQAALLALAAAHLYPNYRQPPSSSCAARAAKSGTKRASATSISAPASPSRARATRTRAMSPPSAEQAGGSSHMSNYFYNEPNILLAAELCRRTGMDRAFFCNSGTEANEALLKLARHHFFRRDRRIATASSLSKKPSTAARSARWR